MSQFQTHYDNLKVARNAPPEVIRAAYKTLSQKFHPDHHQGTEDSTRTFQLISTAYAILSNPEQRELHDQWIARTETQIRQQTAATRSRRVDDDAGRPEKTGQINPAPLPIPGMLELSKMLRTSRSLAFTTSVMLILLMLLMLLHA